jgi:DNA (cytosine-5)-methyltransferase 1
MRFGSVCSGIEAASVAWHPLGWRTAWLAEIEPFPSAVLAHHYPDVPNLGDMTKLAGRILNGEIEAPDVFCGGTPCQAFSVAGLRKSLDDARGNLSLTFCEIANAIDNARSFRGVDPSIVFWENVPGVLNTKDNAFGCFLGALAGESDALIAPGGRWTDAGYVSGPQRTIAWRVLDAQYFGLAQRRKRVFVVASARAGFDPAAVLFEFDGVRRDSAPSRETGESVAGTIAKCSFSGGAGGRPEGAAGNHFVSVVPTLDASFGRLQGCSGQDANHGHGHLIPQLAQCITTGTGSRYDPETETILPAIAFHPTQDPIHSSDGSTHALGCGSSGGQASVAVAYTIDEEKNANVDMYGTLQARRDSGGFQGVVAQPPAMQVRRLTPVECERLQGFPDGYTDIKPKGKPTPDGPRYKALGNSWAVPVVAWIGRRIDKAVSQ